jgi:hypothetical protein
MRSILVLPILLTACVAPSAPVEKRMADVPTQPKVPTPVPETNEVALPQGHWTDWPITKGNWVYRQDERGSIGYFGETGKTAMITIRCDKARQHIYLSRAGVAAGPQITLRTSSISKTLQAGATGSTPPYIAVELSPMDPILDAMAYSRGRFALEAAGHTPLAIPLWAEISKVIEDCRM